MKIKKGYKLKVISGRQTVVADRRIIKSFSSVIVLNESAVFLWELISREDLTQEEMLERLINETNMSRLLAISNTNVFVKTMKENGIIED